MKSQHTAGHTSNNAKIASARSLRKHLTDMASKPFVSFGHLKPGHKTRFGHVGAGPGWARA